MILEDGTAVPYDQLPKTAKEGHTRYVLYENPRRVEPFRYHLVAGWVPKHLFDLGITPRYPKTATRPRSSRVTPSPS